MKLYFEDVLLDVDVHDVLQKWNDAVFVMDMSFQVIEMFRQRIYREHLRQNHIQTAQWRDKMMDITIRLLKLEKRFDKS